MFKVNLYSIFGSYWLLADTLRNVNVKNVELQALRVNPFCYEQCH